MTQLRYEHMILLSWLEHLELHWPGSKRLQWLTSVTWCSLWSLSMHLLNLVYLIRYGFLHASGWYAAKLQMLWPCMLRLRLTFHSCTLIVLRNSCRPAILVDGRLC